MFHKLQYLFKATYNSHHKTELHHPDYMRTSLLFYNPDYILLYYNPPQTLNQSFPKGILLVSLINKEFDRHDCSLEAEAFYMKP